MSSSKKVSIRQVNGFDRYFVSEDGRVFSELNPAPRKAGGYREVKLRRAGRTHGKLVHRLVAEAYVPGAGEHVRHLDGDPTNNRSSNLAWGTAAENAGDKIRHGTTLRGEKNHQAKLLASQVAEIRQALQTEKRSVIAARYGVATRTISAIANGENWSYN